MDLFDLKLCLPTWGIFASVCTTGTTAAKFSKRRIPGTFEIFSIVRNQSTLKVWHFHLAVGSSHFASRS
jgi:hypothetical protein